MDNIMTSVVLILNPQADRGRNRGRAEALQRRLGTSEVTLQTTAGRGDAIRLAAEAAAQGADVVVAVGGDGTVHEVINGLLRNPLGRRPALGVLPAGSGNDFAFSLGLPLDVEAAGDVIERGSTRLIDAARIEAPQVGAVYWGTNVGMLLDGQINLASHRLTWPRGSGLYFRAALEELLRRPQTAQLRWVMDGREGGEEAMVFSLGNGPRSGGRFLLTPEAVPDDGWIDYVLVRPQSRWRLVRLLLASARGGHAGSAGVGEGRFRTLELESSLPLAIHVDGEPWVRPEQGVVSCRVEVLREALRVVME
jgi:diacylglycerol kinase (ATP)